MFPVSTESEVLEIIAKRKSETFGARHNVYAYILRDNNITRYSDDGEPHSTAGIPTLDVLKKSGLTDCLVVTTRYFGGVLLGTGGLVRAYTAAAVGAVEAAGVALMRECYSCRVVCHYSDHRQVERTIADCGGKINGSEFTDSVEVSFSIVAFNFEKLCEKFHEVFCGKLVPEVKESIFDEV